MAIKIRAGTAAEWTSANPILAVREEGLETDTGKRKLGNGVTAWNTLPYLPDDDLVAAYNAAKA